MTSRREHDDTSTGLGVAPPPKVVLVNAGSTVRRFSCAPPAIADVVALKAGRRLGACIPARNEAATIARVVTVARQLEDAGLLDHIVVVDDGSFDGTGARAESAGTTVVSSTAGPGKGQALTCALGATEAEVIVFLDADVTNLFPGFVTALVAPVLSDDTIQLAKAAYRRPLDGRPDEGGRVTELLARPLLRRFFPELAGVSQPLAGECAIRRSTLDGIALADGYGIEIVLLIDVYQRHGLEAIAEVDLGERVHRNRRLQSLRPHADEVLDAVLARMGSAGPAATRGYRPRETLLTGVAGAEERAAAPGGRSATRRTAADASGPGGQKRHPRQPEGRPLTPASRSKHGPRGSVVLGAECGRRGWPWRRRRLVTCDGAVAYARRVGHLSPSRGAANEEGTRP